MVWFVSKHSERPAAPTTCLLSILSFISDLFHTRALKYILSLSSSSKIRSPGLIQSHSLLTLGHGSNETATMDLKATQGTSVSTINKLPPELLLHIISFLPYSSLVSLKLSSKRLFQWTPDPIAERPNTITDCEKTALQRYTSERKEEAGGRRKCIHCGILAPIRRFSGIAPLCHWHEARFMSTSIPKHLESSTSTQLLLQTRERDEAAWFAVETIMYCAHMRTAIGWHVRDCKCKCESCGHHPIRCLVRVSPTTDIPQLMEPTRDGQFVSEEHWVLPSVSDQISTIFAREILGQTLGAYKKLVPIISLQT